MCSSVGFDNILEDLGRTRVKLSVTRRSVYLPAVLNFCNPGGPLMKAASAVSENPKDGTFCLLHKSCDDWTFNVQIRKKNIQFHAILNSVTSVVSTGMFMFMDTSCKLLEGNDVMGYSCNWYACFLFAHRRNAEMHVTEHIYQTVQY